MGLASRRSGAPVAMTPGASAAPAPTRCLRRGRSTRRGVVAGGVVGVAAGDMIPADVRLLSAKDLFVSQSSLTGESLPVEKGDTLAGTPGSAPLEAVNLCFLGTSVQSGTATAVVVETGPRTLFGTMARAKPRAAPPTPS